MKFFIVALCVACAAAASVDLDATVVRNDYNLTPEGNYQYSFETSNGISGEAVAQLKQYNKDESALEVQGQNKFTSPEGQVFSLTFTADANGYRAVGDHLPTTPPPQPIPDYILRSLEYIAAHPYVEKKV